jgi:hypothetical protein
MSGPRVGSANPGRIHSREQLIPASRRCYGVGHPLERTVSDVDVAPDGVALIGRL